MEIIIIFHVKQINNKLIELDYITFYCFVNQTRVRYIIPRKKGALL
jgi:hypothetical protein